MKTEIKSALWARKLYRTRWFWTIRNAVKNIVQRRAVRFEILDDSRELDAAEPVLIAWPGDCAKPRVGLVRDRNKPPYWTKYERFLRNNAIAFEHYDIHLSNWLTEAKRFDVVIWATEGVAPEIEEHKRKVFMLERHCGVSCYPAFETLMWNEDKLYQYDWLRSFGFPIQEALVSNSPSEVFQRIPQCSYPLVTKVPVGAGSLGVELVKNKRQAMAIAQQAFSPVGRPTIWPYFRQKGYVYFQDFLPNAGYDLRIIAVGDRAFGYYRDVPPGEFRASGMGLVRKGSLPDDALQLAMKLVKELNLVIAAVDMLRDQAGNLHIIEVQANIQVDTPGQLHVDGVPGAYVFDSNGDYHFEPCQVWIQELALQGFFQRWILDRSVSPVHA